ncbi:MAG: hypothetical protein ACRBM6_17980 [Geminicoccales bacterium]
MTAVKMGVLLFGGSISLALALGGLDITGRVAAAFDLPGLAHEELRTPVMLTILLIYMVLLACPFVPGAEIGLVLLVLFGAYLAPLVYLATVVALCLSFCIGRMVPKRIAKAFFRRLALERAGDTITIYDREIRVIEAKACLRGQTIRSRWLGQVLKCRCLAVVVLINTPGNSVLGGGGGIALTVGLARLMPFGQFLISVALAVAPVPIAVGYFGWLTG